MRARVAAAIAAVALASCQGRQSAFAPSGVEAERTLTLFWIMTAAGGAIFVAVVVMMIVAVLVPERIRRFVSRNGFVFGAGVVFPIAALSILLIYGLFVLKAGGSLAGASPETAPAQRIAVSGERWWWRVTYFDGKGRVLESANEIHLAVGEPVRLELTSPDVIHSFWAPQLAGKLDMIPGRTNVLTISATRPGISRGQCAEYCGGPHAMMSFNVVVHETQAELDDWLDREARPAREPVTADEREGQRLFLANGCGACHTIRGTAADGRIGPDLTHVGGRLSLAAATLSNTAENFAAWIAENQHIKPDNRMPSFTVFTERELRQLGVYLESLD